MVDAGVAQTVARREIEVGPQQSDPQFSSWNGATAGEPQLVHDLDGLAAYWLVPVQQKEAVVGAVRVLADGRTAASIAYRGVSNLLTMDRAEILKDARALINESDGERSGEVLLVHDGPPGREAWRVEVILTGEIVRWIFVTSGGTYQRMSTHRQREDSLTE
jgi:hypothetical protein